MALLVQVRRPDAESLANESYPYVPEAVKMREGGSAVLPFRSTSGRALNNDSGMSGSQFGVPRFQGRGECYCNLVIIASSRNCPSGLLLFAGKSGGENLSGGDVEASVEFAALSVARRLLLLPRDGRTYSHLPNAH